MARDNFKFTVRVTARMVKELKNVMTSMLEDRTESREFGRRDSLAEAGFAQSPSRKARYRVPGGLAQGRHVDSGPQKVHRGSGGCSTSTGNTRRASATETRENRLGRRWLLRGDGHRSFLLGWLQSWWREPQRREVRAAKTAQRASR